MVNKLTKDGFLIQDLPKLIKMFVSDIEKITIQDKNKIVETVENTGVTNSICYHFLKADIQGIMMMFHEYMKVFHEQFCNHKLNPSAIYGIREYQNGSTLHMHKDREDTHHISSIIPIGFDKDWPLEFHSHDGTIHQLNVQPGQIVFYESATCMHGRPSPFKGKWYRNFYIHYMLNYD